MTVGQLEMGSGQVGRGSGVRMTVIIRTMGPGPALSTASWTGQDHPFYR